MNSLRGGVGILSLFLVGCAPPPPPLTAAQYASRHVADVFIVVPDKQSYYWEIINESFNTREVVNESDGPGDPGMAFGKPRLESEQALWKGYAPHLSNPGPTVRAVVRQALGDRLGSRSYFDLRTPEFDPSRIMVIGELDKASPAKLDALPIGTPGAEWALVLDIRQVGLALLGYHTGNAFAAMRPPDGLGAMVGGHLYLVNHASKEVMWHRAIDAATPLDADADLDDLVSRRAMDYPPALIRASEHFAELVAYQFVRGEPGFTDESARAAVKRPDKPIDPQLAEIADIAALRGVIAAAPPKPPKPVTKTKGH